MRTAGQGPQGFETRDGEMRPGQDLIMAGYAGLDGACGIARARREELERRFCSAFLKQLAGPTESSPAVWAEEHLGADITAYEGLGEGGVLAALWNLSGVFNAGIEFDLRRIPIRQATVEICELYGLNPYRLRSGGGFVAGQWRAGGARPGGGGDTGRGDRKRDPGHGPQDEPRRRERRFSGAAPAG